LPAELDLRGLAATIKARWVCEQAHQRLKEELGLDHFEGRSWHGLHRHAPMTMISNAFFQLAASKKLGQEKKNQRSAASTHVASHSPRHRRSYHSSKPSTVSVPPNLDRYAKAT
jgi:SRSO17 transposase